MKQAKRTRATLRHKISVLLKIFVYERIMRSLKTFKNQVISGLEKLHHLTNSRSCSLRVDLWNFDDEFAYAEYRFDLLFVCFLIKA